MGGAHPLIRIKPKHHSASPRPPKAKQLSHGGGFQPYRAELLPRPARQITVDRSNRPIPGKTEVVEVVHPGRRGQPIVFDNDQEIITGPRIVKDPSTNSFSVDVKASFAPQGRPNIQRRVERRRSIHLPKMVLPRRGGAHKRQRSLEIEEMDELPFFDRMDELPEMDELPFFEGMDELPEMDVLPFFESVRV